MIRLCLVLFATAALARAEITRGPYIQMPDRAGPLVIWQTNHAEPSRVAFGLTRDCRDGELVLTNATREHVVQLAGLPAGTNGYYRVGGITHIVHTRRRPGQSHRFAIIGDFGTISASAGNIARQINAARIDLLLTVGDNVYPGGERQNYDPHLFRPYAPVLARIPLFPALGNHDVLTENGQPFLDSFHLPANGPPGLVERNYSFDYGNAHFVCIDSNPFAAGSKAVMKAIADWVKRDLAGSQQPWKFAYFHHPAYTSRSHHDETPGVKTALMPVLEAGGVQMVFAGHNHFYERIKPIHGVVEVIAGGSGHTRYPVAKRRDYSAALVNDRGTFVLVEVNGPQLRLRAIDEAGQTADAYVREGAPR